MFLGKKSEKVTSLRRIAGSPLSVLNSHLTGSTRQTPQAAPLTKRKPLMTNASEYITHIVSRSPCLICTGSCRPDAQPSRRTYRHACEHPTIFTHYHAYQYGILISIFSKIFLKAV